MGTPGFEGLAEEEKRVLEFLVRGTTTQIAIELQVTPDMVRTHVQDIMAKLGVQSQLEAVAYAVRWGLLPPVSPDE